MAIVEKKQMGIVPVDLSPVSIPIPIIIDAKNELDSLKEEIIPLQDVNAQNIKLAIKLKELRGKYKEEKEQHRKTTKLMREYYLAENTLNVVDMFCPYLKKEITLVNCNHSCLNGYCDSDWGYEKCTTRINAILQHFKIPTE